MIGPLNDYDDIYSRMSPALKAIYFFSFQKSSGIDVDLSHIHRAIEHSIFFLEGESGAKPIAGMKNSGQLDGILSDYYHFHIPQSTKSAIGFNAKKAIGQALDGLKDDNGNTQLSQKDIKQVFANVASTFQGYDYTPPPKKELSPAELEQIARNEQIDKSLEASVFTGDWLIYSIKNGKKRYLTITEHVKISNNEQQRILKDILDASDKF